MCLQRRSSKERARYVDASHNACIYTVTNRPWYLLVACKPIAKGDIIEAHYGPYSGILLHTFRGQFCALSAETYLDTSLSLLLSTRCFCAGSLWHIKQLSVHQAAKCLQDGAEWLIFPTYMQISWILRSRVIDWFGMIAKKLGIFFMFCSWSAL